MKPLKSRLEALEAAAAKQPDRVARDLSALTDAELEELKGIVTARESGRGFTPEMERRELAILNTLGVILLDDRR